MLVIFIHFKIKIKKILFNNKIKRTKNVNGNDHEFLYRFMYHDISILYNHIKNKKVEIFYFQSK